VQIKRKFAIFFANDKNKSKKKKKQQIKYITQKKIKIKNNENL